MGIIIAVLTVVGGALFFWARSNPGDAIDVASDAVTVARNAPRKLAFRRGTREHPIQGIDDPVLAIATIATGFLELDGPPMRDDLERLTVALRKTWRMTEEEAEELTSLSRWLVEQSGGGSQAVERAARRLYRLDEGASWSQLRTVLDALGTPAHTPAQIDTLQELERKLTRPQKH